MNLRCQVFGAVFVVVFVAVGGVVGQTYPKLRRFDKGKISEKSDEHVPATKIYPDERP